MNLEPWRGAAKREPHELLAWPELPDCRYFFTNDGLRLVGRGCFPAILSLILASTAPLAVEAIFLGVPAQVQEHE
jgi:hypothetical protein